ncbi:MAG: hypothetical protein GDA49_00770 [Rhodospirillales bacterium]|nr:hypothetical protein [Rhodospirillales bacterium]
MGELLVEHGHDDEVREHGDSTVDIGIITDLAAPLQKTQQAFDRFVEGGAIQAVETAVIAATASGPGSLMST